ncbi:MAG: site-2 protease family protein, partial [Planctomycetota bacterium]|nr:site-2 protease family protein [Planctomycetota bacterium]
MEFLSSIITTLIGIFWIILGFGALIFIHELGHFLAAKWAGIRAEAFAVGMGPVALAWRKGIGLRYGSTLAEYERLTREYIQKNGSDDLKAREKDNTLKPEELYRMGDELGLGETEYSLRWLPIGGFVKMLGQEDANPEYVSDDPKSYNSCPIGKRMIVVSAGVVMNLILAAILFVWAFLVGVRLPAPVIGHVSFTLPAGTTMADNAAALGISEPGLKAGDLVTMIDGKPANTFADLQIASAMSKVDQEVVLTVQREGIDEPLQFSMVPQLDQNSGLRSIGITPGQSTTLIDKDQDDIIKRELMRLGLDEAGLELGMRMLSVNGIPVTTYEQFSDLAAL